MFNRIVLLAGMIAGLYLPSHGTTVSTGAELKTALDAAAPGDTVLLAPRTYGKLGLGYTFTGPVYVTAADTADRPLLNRIQLSSGSKNLVFSYLEVFSDSQYIDGSYHDLIRMDGTSSITFEHCSFTGITIDNDSAWGDGYGSGFAFKGGNVDSLTIRHCEFTNLNKCISMGLADSYVGFNYFHHYRSDAFYLKPGTNVIFENNYLYAPRPFVLDGGAADHPDVIQGGELKDVIIRNNFVNQGPGIQTQGFFLSGVGRADAGNLLIENNILYTGMANALTLNTLPNSVVRNNLVLSDYADLSYAPKLGISGAVGTTLVENNIAEKLVDNSTSGTVTMTNNIDCQRTDPDGAWYYGDIFVGAMDDSAAMFESFFLVEGALDTFSVKPGVDYTKFTQFGLWDPPSSVFVPDAGTAGAAPSVQFEGCYDMAGRYYPQSVRGQLPAGVYVRMHDGGPAAFTVVR